MSPVFTARRQADELQRALSGDLDPSSLSQRDAVALASLLDLVGQLRVLTPPPPRPDQVAELRERLMVEADSVLRPIDTATEARLRLTVNDPTARPRERRLATVLGGAVLIGATASVAVAAQGALPGQVLYPVKRAIENVRTDISTDDGAKARLLLANASGRLDEVDQLAREGTPAGIAALPGTLKTFSEQAGEAGELLLADYQRTGREGSITELRDFTGASMTMLARLEGTLPDGARDELLEAARTVASYDARASAACPTCAGVGVTEMPTVLASAGDTVSVVTVPSSLPGIESPTTTPRPTGDAKPGGDDSPGGDRATTDDTTDGLPVPVPQPTPLPPTKKPGKDVVKDTTKSATDTLDTITGTLTGTPPPGTGPAGPVGGPVGGSVGGTVGGVVDGVDDVLAGTGATVDGVTGGLTGGVTGGLTGP